MQHTFNSLVLVANIDKGDDDFTAANQLSTMLTSNAVQLQIEMQRKN